MTSIGETLRRERLRRGWELDKISKETKVSRHLLEAIEADDFDLLPGEVFAKSFIRQYARLLGLDEEEVMAELKPRFEEPEPAEVIPEPKPRQVRLPRLPPLEDFRQRLQMSPSLWAFLWLVGVMVTCAGVYSFWQKSHGPPAQREVILSVSQRAQPGVARPAASSHRAVIELPQSDFRPAEVSESGTIHVPAGPARPAHVEKIAGPGPGYPSPSASAAMRVAITATEPVWISVKSDGNRVYTGTLAPHETKQLQGSRKMFVFLGNAGGVEMTLNGKPVGPFGSSGEIRLVEFTPQGAHIVPRTPPPTPEDSTAPAAAADVRP